MRAISTYDNGTTGVLELSWTSPVGAGLLEVYGSKGAIRAGFGKQPIELTQVTDKGPKVSYPAPETNVADSFQTFAAAVRGEAPSKTPGELGRDALAICDAIAQSGATGQVTDVARF